MNEQFSFDTLSGVDFELYLKSIFENLGYEVDLTPASNDYGADLIISKEQTKTVIQAKRYNKPVGKSAIQEILGAISYYNADSGIVVTNNYFTPNAINLANSAHIALWDRDVLIKQALNSFNPNNNSNKGSVQLDIDVLSLIEDLDNIHHLLIEIDIKLLQITA